MQLPQGIANFALHGTPLVAPRETAVMELPADPTGYSYPQRQSSFNGTPAVTRNIEYYISLNEYGTTLVFHYQWANPRFDGVQKLVADKFARMIRIVPLES